MADIVLDYEAVKKAIPHRFPFLLIDRVTITDPDKSAVGIKCVSGNEPFFQGHFPERAIMPGVLIVEAMALSGGATRQQVEAARRCLTRD